MSIYKDFGFELEDIVQDGVTVHEDELAINQSIKNILFTQKKEVPFDPLFGSGVRNLLFEKMTPLSSELLKEEIYFALNNHEPRILINSIDVTPIYDENRFDVSIYYNIVYLDIDTQYNLSLNLQGI